jgi:hypothetical protein
MATDNTNGWLEGPVPTVAELTARGITAQYIAVADDWPSIRTIFIDYEHGVYWDGEERLGEAKRATFTHWMPLPYPDNAEAETPSGRDVVDAFMEHMVNARDGVAAAMRRRITKLAPPPLGAPWAVCDADADDQGDAMVRQLGQFLSRSWQIRIGALNETYKAMQAYKIGGDPAGDLLCEIIEELEAEAPDGWRFGWRTQDGELGVPVLVYGYFPEGECTTLDDIGWYA